MNPTRDDTSSDPQRTIAKLQQEVLETRRELDERVVERVAALARETVTAEVLQVIDSSPGDLAPVFEVILEKAHSLCDAAFGALVTYDGEFCRLAAECGLPPAWADFVHGRFRPEPHNPVSRLCWVFCFVRCRLVTSIAAAGRDLKLSSRCLGKVFLTSK